jgi:hypothetical protein
VTLVSLPISEVCAAAMLVLLMLGIKKYKSDVTSSGMMFIPSFVELYQLTQKLQEGIDSYISMTIP